MNLEITKGEVICDKCSGGGYDKNEYINMKQYGTIPHPQKVCGKCKGEGKLDWVENLIGKKKTYEYEYEYEYKEIAIHYIRTNQSYSSMFYDDFTSLVKTNILYDRMDNNKIIEWRSNKWMSPVKVTNCKVIWHRSNDFNYNIEISADNGNNWTVIYSKSKNINNYDTDTFISNSENEMVLRIVNGDKGKLHNYTILVR